MLKSMSSIGFFDSEMTHFKASVNLSQSSIYGSKQDVLDLYDLIQEHQQLRNNEYLRMNNPSFPKRKNELSSHDLVLNIKL